MEESAAIANLVWRCGRNKSPEGQDGPKRESAATGNSERAGAMIVLAVTIGFLVTFSLFITAIAMAIIGDLRKDRQLIEQLQQEFEEIVDRLGDEEGGRK
jgi:hypothetical protein